MSDTTKSQLIVEKHLLLSYLEILLKTSTFEMEIHNKCKTR